MSAMVLGPDLGGLATVDVNSWDEKVDPRSRMALS
jgi:hypothetical protein